MISRVAENLYWMHRYVERFEGTGRLLHTTTSMMLDVEEANRWGSVLTVAGEHPSFLEYFDASELEDEKVVRHFMTWDDRCASSLIRCLGAARENARTTRESISREVWEVVNSAWLWMTSDEARREFADDPLGFYRRTRTISHEFRGAMVSTMLRDEPLDFMELGMFLERADQTARALDVKHHLLGPNGDTTGSVAETVAWISTLLTCSGMESYFKLHPEGVEAVSVAEFLLFNRRFPRSVTYCLTEAVERLERVRGGNLDASPAEPVAQLISLRERLSNMTIQDVFDSGIHDELTAIVDTLAEVGEQLYPQYFQPAEEHTPVQANSQ
jgi:uncharacterized alpha-E superfamily protein